MVSDEKSVFLLAGEPSGDRIGAALLEDLGRQIPHLQFKGVGGAHMQALGLKSLFPMSDLSVMGFSDVIKRLPLLLWRIRQMARFIKKAKPTTVVLIDSQVFSELLARQLRKSGYTGSILLYVSPSVWAWKPERAPRLATLFNEVLAVLPFEPRVMQDLEGPLTTYVGHPALDRIPACLRPDTVEQGPLLLLPGSRMGEIRRHLPVLRPLAEKLHSNPRISQIVLITLALLEDGLRAETADWSVPVKIISAEADRTAALQEARAALVTAGTITLEFALAGVPMVGTYVPDKRLMHHYEKAGRPRIALPNIILDEDVIPEVTPGENLSARLESSLTSLINDDAQIAEQRQSFERMRELMVRGEQEHTRQKASDRILTYLVN